MGLGGWTCVHTASVVLTPSCPSAKQPVSSCHVVLLGVCQGCPKHRLVEGRLKDGRNVSEHVAEYTSKFVKSIMDLCVPDLPELNTHQIDLAACDDVECLSEGLVPAQPDSQEFPAESSPADDPARQSEERIKIQQAVKKLHVNLGHPSNRNLVRILTPTQQSIRTSHQIDSRF